MYTERMVETSWGIKYDDRKYKTLIDCFFFHTDFRETEIQHTGITSEGLNKDGFGDGRLLMEITERATNATQESLLTKPEDTRDRQFKQPTNN